MLDTGQHPQLGVELLRESCLETLNDFASRMGKAMDEACPALTQAADNMAQFYYANHRETPLYKIGDKVWLNSQNITTTQPTKKLDHKWLSSYPKRSLCGTCTVSSYSHPLAEPTPSFQ